MDLTLLDIVARTVCGVVGVSAVGVTLRLIGRKVKRDAEALAEVGEMRAVHAVRLVNVVPDDLVRTSGVALPRGELVKTRFSGRACIAHQCSLIVNPGVDARVFETSEHGELYIEDEGARALVRGEIPVIALVDRASGEWTSETLPPHVREWLQEATASDEWEHSRHLRWVERWIEPGERVCVVGAATLQLDEGGGRRRLPAIGGAVDVRDRRRRAAVGQQRSDAARHFVSG